MKDESIRDNLADITANMTLAVEFIQDLTFAKFEYDPSRTYGVIRCMEIIGEATKRLPDEFRMQNPSISAESNGRNEGSDYSWL